MKKLTGGLLSAFLLSSVINTPAFASETTMEPQVKVKLVNYIGNQKQLSIHPSGEYLVDGTNIHLTSDKTYTVKYDNHTIELLDGTTILYTASDLDVEPFHESDYLSINNRKYLGSLDFIQENSAYVRPINTIYMEDYLKGVVPFEMMGSWNREALKAQAVAARTYAYSKLGMTIDDTINYQAYGGFDWYPNATAAVDETKGEVLTYNHALISAVYSASNGGRTESNANVWGGTSAAYLPIKDDPFDAKIPWSISIKKVEIDPTVTSWTSMKEADTIITNNIKTWMSSHGFAGKEIKITSIPVLSLHNPTSGGRVSKGDITVNFYTKDAVDINGNYIPQQLVYQNVAASQIRAMVGIQNMLSYLVTNQTITNDSITITGLGNGHGVGMSQWGTKNRADAGQTYRDILSFYYDGTSIERRYSERPAFIAPAGDTTAVAISQPSVMVDNQNQTGSTLTNVPQTSADNVTLSANSNIVTNQTPVVEKTETVKISTPIISNVTTGYDGVNNLISLNYSVNQDVLATIYIKDATGKIVTYLQKSLKQSTGKQNAVYKTTNLPNGIYTFGISVTNSNQLSASAIKTVTVNKEVPKPSINLISDKDPVVSGTAIPNAQIIVSSGNKVIGSTKTNSAGKYTLSIPKQKEGTVLSVVAKDSIGNVSSPSTATVLDKTPPAVPKVYAVSNRDTILTGLAEANATVTIKSGSKIIGTGKVDEHGKFRIAIPKQKAHTVLTASAKDKANNSSPTVAFKVLAR